MMLSRKFTILGNLIRMLVLFGLLGSLIQTSTPAAAAGCRTRSNSDIRSARLVAGNWTTWYYDTTTANCANFWVAVVNHGCYVLVDAQYKNSAGVWKDGAHDDIWIAPSDWYDPINWYDPIRNILNNVTVRVRFFPVCSDSLVYVWTAA